MTDDVSMSSSESWDLRDQAQGLFEVIAKNLGHLTLTEFVKDINEIKNKNYYKKFWKTYDTATAAENMKRFIKSEFDKVRGDVQNSNSMVDMQSRVDDYGCRLRSFVDRSLLALKDGKDPPKPENFFYTNSVVIPTPNVFYNPTDLTASITRLEGQVRLLENQTAALKTALDNEKEEKERIKKRLDHLESLFVQLKFARENEDHIRRQKEREQEREREREQREREERSRKEEEWSRRQAEERYREERLRQEKQKQQIQAYQNLSRQFTIYFDKKTCAMNTKSIDILFRLVRDALSQHGFVPNMEIVESLPLDLSQAKDVVVTFMYYPPARFLPSIISHASSVVETIGASNWCGVLLERVENPTQIRQFDDLTKQASIWTTRWNNDSDPTEADIIREDLQRLVHEIVKLVREKITTAINLQK